MFAVNNKPILAQSSIPVLPENIWKTQVFRRFQRYTNEILDQSRFSTRSQFITLFETCYWFEFIFAKYKEV